MSLPSHAKRVFKGVIFEVWQWEQKMLDGSRATFERIVRPDVTQVMALQGENIIFAQQRQPLEPSFYSFFGGRIEEGEDSLSAAKRELLEESGLTSDSWKKIRTYEHSGKIQFKVHLFVAKNCKKVAEQKLDAGGEDIQILSMPLQKFLREILPLPDFHARELRQEMMSAFDEQKAEHLIQDILNS